MALELARYNIDIAAPSETRLHGEESLSEVGAGYTLFWKGVPEGTLCNHGVGFAVKSKLLQYIPKCCSLDTEAHRGSLNHHLDAYAAGFLKTVT